MFGSAEAFLAAGAAARVQCLVLDVNLPGMSGPELAGRLHAIGRWVPTVFVTARAVNETSDCLVKPFPAETLLQAVSRSVAGTEAH